MSLPRYEPMVAVPWPRPFSDPEWLFEVKWDGVRLLLYWDGAAVRLRTRRGRDATATYPELAGFRWPRPAVLDGEVIVLDEAGNPSFERLQQRMNLAGGARIAEAARNLPVSFVVFDVLYDGIEVIEEPLTARRSRLVGTLPPPLVLSEVVEGEGEALFAAVAARGMEGVVAKRRASVYRPGARSPDWRKVPYRRLMRAVVGGFTPGERGRAGTFGSLLVGLWEGSRLRWIGNVGTGFDDRSLFALRETLDELLTDASPFHEEPQLPSDARWVTPALLVRVEFKEWTGAGRLRAASFKGLVAEPPASVTWRTEGPG